jgi:hypothetical protein
MAAPVSPGKRGLLPDRAVWRDPRSRRRESGQGSTTPPVTDNWFDVGMGPSGLLSRFKAGGSGTWRLVGARAALLGAWQWSKI